MIGNSGGQPMTPLQFVEKWKPVTLTERAAAQSHFCDLCHLLDHPDPVAADPVGDWFTFEKGVAKSGGGDGFADVWKRDFFAWEYKKRKRNLDEALGQLARYALALENPPLHVACDTDRFRIVTAWTNTVPRSFDISLDDLLVPKKLDILRSVFYQPDALKPGETRADLTKAAADKFSSISVRLQTAGNAPEDVAHFVTRLVFLFFAEDVRLLPKNYFRRILREMSDRPQECTELLDGLFKVLRKGGRFGVDRLPHVNGGLFDDRPALSLDASDVILLVAAGSENWAHIDPTIFGTLFERLLDPDKRSQVGAHYTDEAKIMMILEPVIFQPLKYEWSVARDEIEKLASKARIKGPRAKEWVSAEERRSKFIERLRRTSILDAACGSGNFLYLALQGVKNLEHAANQECETFGLRPLLPVVGPEIIHGIEINPLAAELARTTIWIGDIQWSIQNGIYTRPEPILRPLETIECRDALICTDENGDVTEAEWPLAEFIVGNPPFLGDKKFTSKLAKSYVEALRNTYAGRVGGNADLVCYWFEKAKSQIEIGATLRAGLVATNSIRRGANRRTLDRIANVITIFDARSDEKWVLEGAAVRVSIICFGRTYSDELHLDGRPVARIHPDLTSGAIDITKAVRLHENIGVSFLGIQKSGPLDVPGHVAREWLLSPSNPSGKSNASILRPYLNGDDITSRIRDYWLIDFPRGRSETEVALYQQPYEFLKSARYQPDDPEDLRTLQTARSEARDRHARERWWEPYWPRPEMRTKVAALPRYIVTPETPTYTVFAWLPSTVVPDKNLIVIVRDDDTSFGILNSKAHLLWVRALGSPYGNHPTARRYNNSRVFETFPFPSGLTPNIPSANYIADRRAIAVSDAARRLDSLRINWLNPPDLVREEPEVFSGYPDRILPRDASAALTLRERTLTNLYNSRPQWLIDAHSDLDAAVAAAYGWHADISDDEILARLLELNLFRSAVFSPEAKQPKTKRKKRGTAPEELRQSPQFTFPIAGGKHDVPTIEVRVTSPRPPKSKSRSKSQKRS